VPVPPTLDPAGFASVVADGAQIVDARPPAVHVSGHIPGSISIPLDESFGTWLGWVVDLDRPVALVVARPDDVEPLMRQAIRIGRDAVSGVIVGLDAWAASGRPVRAGGRSSIAALARSLDGADLDDRPLLIDVRQASEYEAGHVPGAWHIDGGSLPDRLAEMPRDRPIATICEAGFRASIAASLLRAAGFDRTAWVEEGFPGWQAAGYPVETGRPPGPRPA
jgi:hydroxyacylglutathione hydrolase